MAKRLLILGLLVASFSATAQTTFGATDCGNWVKQTTETRKAWLLGYMSGLNMMHEIREGRPGDPLKKVNSAEQIFLWMDKYCRENPLNSVGIGGADLFIELLKK